VNLDNKQLDTLRHMLGINTPRDRVPVPNRNYAAVVPGDPEFLVLAELGAIEKAGRQYTLDYYQCTDTGRHVALASHRQIRYTKAKRIYCRFLSARDCFPDLTFKAFLTSSQFAQSRAEA
jgi:hypothetical protein